MNDLDKHGPTPAGKYAAARKLLLDALHTAQDAEKTWRALGRPEVAADAHEAGESLKNAIAQVPNGGTAPLSHPPQEL